MREQVLGRFNLYTLTRQCRRFLFQEGQTRNITLLEDDPKMIASMVYFIYTGDYKDDGDGKLPMLYNAGMYAVGDKYDIPLLKDLAASKFSNALQAFDNFIVNVFIDAIHTVYTTTLSSDRNLRDRLIPVLKSHKKVLRKDDGFMNLFSSGLDDGGFAIDVVDAWADFEVPVITPAVSLSSALDGSWDCLVCGSMVNSVYQLCCPDRDRPRASRQRYES